MVKNVLSTELKNWGKSILIAFFKKNLWVLFIIMICYLFIYVSIFVRVQRLENLNSAASCFKWGVFFFFFTKSSNYAYFTAVRETYINLLLKWGPMRHADCINSDLCTFVPQERQCYILHACRKCNPQSSIKYTKSEKSINHIVTQAIFNAAITLPFISFPRLSELTFLKRVSVWSDTTNTIFIWDVSAVLAFAVD